MEIFNSCSGLIESGPFISSLLWSCCCSVTKSCPTHGDPMDCSMPGSSVLHCLLNFAQIHVHWVTISSSVTPFYFLQPFPASGSLPISLLFTSEGQSIRASASANTPSSEISGLISFRIDWLDLLAVHGTLRSLLQHHSLKASILQHSAFFMIQLISIHDYWKNHSFDYTDFCWQGDVSTF